MLENWIEISGFFHEVCQAVRPHAKTISMFDDISRQIECLGIMDQSSRTPGQAEQLTNIFNFGTLDEYTSHKLKELMALDECCDMDGWFPSPPFEKDTAYYAFLIVQHANHDLPFQKEMLPLLKRSIEDSLQNIQFYAYLHDRISINSNQAQRYGSQGAKTKDGIWYPFECEMKNPKEVENLGMQLGIRRLNGDVWHLSDYFRYNNKDRPDADTLEIRFLPRTEYTPL